MALFILLLLLRRCLGGVPRGGDALPPMATLRERKRRRRAGRSNLLGLVSVLLRRPSTVGGPVTNAANLEVEGLTAAAIAPALPNTRRERSRML